MDRKNLLGRAVRSGILVTAAAAMLAGNMTAFAAEGDEGPAGSFTENGMITGTVTAVGSDSITVSVAGAMEEIGFGMGQPEGGRGIGMPDGQTPPEKPEGEMPDGQTPPERPEGEMPDGQTPPERPEGEMTDGQLPPERPDFADGERPELPEGGLPELPEGFGDMNGQPEGMPRGGQPEGMPEGGQPQGGRGMGMPFMDSQSGAEVVVSVDDDTVITKGTDAESASLSDITEGSMVMVTFDGDVALTIVVLN